MKGITRLVACALFLCSTLLMAQPSLTSSVGGEITAKAVGFADIVAQKNSELLLIKEQNKLIKEFQSSQQATVYWALSGIMGFVVVLMGLSYFTNFKFYEQDKERIKTDFESRLDSYRAEMNLQLEESKRDVGGVVEHNNQLVQDRVLLQLTEVRASIESVRSELISEIKTMENNFGQLGGILKSVRLQLANAETELREVEMEVWELQGIPENMLISLGQGLLAAAEAENKSGVVRVSRKILDVIEDKFIKVGATIGKGTVKILLEDFSSARVVDPTGMSKLKKALSRIPVEEDEELEA